MTAGNTTNMNIGLVHGGWADGSSWSKVIPILQKSGHKVVAVQLPLHTLADDVATVKRAIEHIGGPVLLVGHSYGGAVITNAGYNNPNVTGLVYIAAFAPDEGQSLSNFADPAKFPKDLFMPDSQGYIYLNPKIFERILLRMSILLRLTSWRQRKSLFISLNLSKNLALQHGNNYQHGIKFLNLIT